MSTPEGSLLVNMREQAMVRSPGWDAKCHSLLLQYAAHRCRGSTPTDCLINLVEHLLTQEEKVKAIKQLFEPK